MWEEGEATAATKSGLVAKASEGERGSGETVVTVVGQGMLGLVELVWGDERRFSRKTETNSNRARQASDTKL